MKRLHRTKARIGAVLPGLVLVAGLVASGAGAWWQHDTSAKASEASFQRAVLRSSDEISERFRRPLYGLSGARGVYATHERVTRDVFRRYVDARNMRAEFPGVHGFGFIQPLPRAGLDAFVAGERADGAPQFAIQQLVQRDAADLFVVKLIEPFEQNAASLGLDIGSEPVRRQAAMLAVETGEATTSGMITLVQDQRRSPGVLLFLPVYGAPAGADPAAPKPLRGLLFAPLVMAELLADLGEVTKHRVRLQLFDTASGTAQGPLMFDSAPEAPGAAGTAAPHFELMRLLDVPGRLLTLRVSSLAAFDAAHSSRRDWLVGLGGSLASLLLAALLRQQTTGRSRAEARAKHMTADLGRLALVARRTSNAVTITDTQRRITWVNEGFERVTGYSPAEALGQSPATLLQSGRSDPATVQALRTALHAGQGYRGEVLNRRKDGTHYWVDLDIQPLHDDHGMPIGFMAIQADITERKQAERALARERLSLHNIIEGTQVGTWEWNVETGQTVFNERWAQIAGYTLAELQATTIETWTQLSHPDDQRQAAVLLERHFDGLTEGYECELRLRHKAGHWVWAMDRGKLFGRSDDGRPRWMAGTRMDITERKQAEAEVQRSAALLRGAIDAIDEAFVLFDPQDRLVFCNDKYRQIYAGMAHRMVPGATFESIIRPGAEAGDYVEAEGRVDEWVAERVTAHRSGNTTLIQALANGRTLRIVERKLPDGHIVGFRVDITEIVRATQDAERATLEAGRALARLQAIYDILPVGLSLTDKQGHIIDCNPASERLLGISKAEHLARAYDGRDWTILREDGTPMPTEEFASVRALTQQVAVHDAVMQVVTPQRSVWLSVSAMPVQHEELGVVIGYVDITEQRAQNAALLLAKSEAEQASVAKSQFLANMSHEIRTPMNAILGMLALLRKTELNSRQADYAVKTEGAARSLLGLLNDILDFSKVEAGKMTLDPHPFRFDQLMRDLGVILSANLGAKPLEVLFDIDPALPRHLVGDAMRLLQVLINLGGNAIKFTPSGEVVVSARVVRRSAGDVTLRVAVRDTGIGIAPENQARIFSGFTQAEASTTRRFGGTGLGVAISQRLVALMGGDLQIDSALGQGTTFHFTLTLPTVAGADADAAPEAVLRTSRPGQTWRALVVDDNPSAREVLQHMTEALGWAADMADSGEAALTLLAARQAAGEHYDAVFVDWQMPGLDGWETAARIRAGGLAADAPLVVMVTAHGREKLEARSGSDKALLDGFLVKPVTASMLLDAVIDARQGRDQPHLSALGRLPAPSGAPRLTGLRLLIAEDNLNNQQVARELLEGEGASVQIANNGLEGVEAVAAADPPFDVVLMDLQMPVMDGFTATMRIRQDLGMATLPIVAMTANAMSSDREACLAAGMNEHVGKPFDLDRLVALLLRVSGRGGPSAPATAALVPAAALPEELMQAALAAGVDLSAALKRLGGKRSVYARMLRNGLPEFEALPALLAQQLASGATEEAGRTLHTLKGVAATLGATGLAAQAGAAEQALADNATPEAAAPHGAAASAALQAALPALRALLACLQAAEAAAAPDATARIGSDPAALHAALTELAGLLANFDMRATEVVNQLRGPSGSTLGPQLQALDDAVGALDFERAAPLCQQLLDLTQA